MDNGTDPRRAVCRICHVNDIDAGNVIRYDIVYTCKSIKIKINLIHSNNKSPKLLEMQGVSDFDILGEL